MKKLIYLLVLPLLFMASCKKADEAKLVSEGTISFTFNPNNVPSAITFKNFQSGEIKTYTNRTEDLKFDYLVKPGDRYSMEMKGKTTGLNNLYTIKIIYNNKVLMSDRALGDASISERVLKIDKTFSTNDFAN